MRFGAENWSKNSDHQLQSNYDVWPWGSNWFAWLETPLNIWACEPRLDDVMGAIFVLLIFLVSSSLSNTKKKLCCNIFSVFAVLTWSLCRKNHWGTFFFLARSLLGWLNELFNGRKRFIHMNGWSLSDSCKDSDFLDFRAGTQTRETWVLLLVASKAHFTSVTIPWVLGMTTETESRFCRARKGKTHDSVDLGWFTRPTFDSKCKEHCGLSSDGCVLKLLGLNFNALACWTVINIIDCWRLQIDCQIPSARRNNAIHSPNALGTCDTLASHIEARVCPK